MLTKIRAIIYQFIAGANIVTVLFLLLCAYSPWVNPVEWPRMSLWGLLFPLFLTAVLLFLLFWLVFHIRYVWISLAGLILCYPSLRAYCPVNWPSQAPADAIKILTFNVHGFNNQQIGTRGDSLVLDYLIRSEAHIIALQEAVTGGHLPQEELDAAFTRKGYHSLRIENENKQREICYSKFPILSAERIRYHSATNGSVAYRLLYEGDTVLFVNNHFESYKLTPDDREQYKDMLKEPERKKIDKEARRLIVKMAKVSAIRAPEVDSVVNYIRNSGCSSAIVCGDFNDSPVSYACHRLASSLTSAFEQSGNGLGVSYNQKGFYVRIDHILFSDDWTSYATRVDKSIGTSDHYPLFTHLYRRKK
ncbi:MAG: endonuclease/exonuclease/phosphatase family protein [Paraprevotella sp.]|nr:endonuclease/exonuclease/phosphatase family protein [Paraprevotella sp.]